MSSFRRRLLIAAAKHYELVPGSDGMIWAYYDVTSTETATKVCNNTGFISGSYMVVDGVQVAKATTYLFGTTGRHLVKFSPITSWGSTTQYFASCPTLVEIYFPAITIQLPYRGFQSNTGLERVSFLDNASISIYSNGQQFRNCTALKYLRLPITQAGNIPGNMLIGCSNLETVELTGSGTLALSTNDPFKTDNAPHLNKLIFGPNYTSITGRLAYGSAITKMVVLATTPPTISASSTAFYNWIIAHKIYVPYSSDHSILAAYKADANWSAQEANIYELNQDGTIPEGTIPEPSTISFTIDNGTITLYLADPGMTWAQWVASAYNTDNYATLITSTEQRVHESSSDLLAVYLNNQKVDPSDTIIASAEYYTTSAGIIDDD